MSVIVGVVNETSELERRVALTPEVAAKIRKWGWHVMLESGAGVAAGFPDSDYGDCEVVDDAHSVLNRADIVFRVSPPDAAFFKATKTGACIIGFMSPFSSPERFQVAAERHQVVFAVELIPRTTRAQAMDALSSQAAVVGYKGTLIAAGESPRFFPMLTTAAGTIRPSHVLVIGAGVAGLQAIATAKRLGAIVTAYDVRPETAEQVESLGAKFLDLGVQAVGEGGYARALTPEELAQQRQALKDFLGKVNVLITTAAVPGRPAPKIITADMARNMKTGSVIVDLAADGGGNCELTEPGKTLEIDGIKVVGPLNVPATVPMDASLMYSRNLYNFSTLLNKDGALDFDWDDEILAGSVLTRDGQMVHPVLTGEKS